MEPLTHHPYAVNAAAPGSGWATPSQRLREALRLLEAAHNALDVREGDVQDLRNETPDTWEKAVLSILNGPLYGMGDSMEAAKDHAAQKYGYSSSEFATMEAIAHVLDPASDKETCR